MQQMCYSSGIMLVEASMEFPLTEQAIMRIAGRVAQTLRQDLEMIAAQVAAPGTRDDQPTVGEVARRLRVAPSTVCAHWREWGGFKLSDGARAPIRFDADRLPAGERGARTAAAAQDAPAVEGDSQAPPTSNPDR
jgi:hypothetical protein